MASSSSSPAPYTGEWEHDVFLCFRGDDTRHGFTSHLLDALSHRQIRTFIDYKLEKTESIDELISILKRSALSVVVFSENFADSSWCLDEVATIARRTTESRHRVLPVFYKVDPSDVTDDSKAYAASIDRKHKGRNTYVEDKKRWMDALKAVTNFSGHTSEDIKIESELIKAIVKDVQKQLINMSSSVKYDNLVAMDLRIFEVEELLAMDQIDDTRIIGLWGMGGVGKTTLARACYQRITSANKGFKYLFVPDINEKCEKNHGVEEIVRKLYSKLLNENNIDREDLSISLREERLLSRLRVFIVLDNVETSQQLEQLALGYLFNLDKVFALGSRIMVTTRNRKVLQNVTSKIYNVECLNDEESTRLFSLHAFKPGCSQDNWTVKYRLVATSYCKGNPLALKILGGALCNEDMHYWKSFLSGLRQTGNLEIHNILRSSYDKLGAAEKKIFVDVACLLYGISRCRLVEYMMALVPSSYATIKDLIDKSFLTCVPDENGEKIEVHDLLKEMAWNIVNEEGNRRILIDPNDIHQLLSTKNQYLINAKHPGKSFFNFFKAIARMKKREVVNNHRKGCNPLEEHRAIEGIHLNCWKKEMYLEADAFEGMKFLTFLKIWNKEKRGSGELNFLSGELNFLYNELRWLEWDEYPSKFLPSKFCPQHLVHLKINFSPIQRCWKGYDQPQLVNLIVLDLSQCQNLIAIPNISTSSKLEELLLKGCKSLVEVPFDVQYLTKLITLDLSGCPKLKCLPRYGGGGGFETQYHVMRDTTPVVDTRTSYARAATPVASSVMHHMHMPKQNPEFLLVETSPPLAARMRYNKGGDKTSSTYDLVEKMHFLYVSVVKCRDLPVMDVTGSLDPYVEVKLGNYKGMTKHHEKNQNPTWHQIFAFSKERLQSNLLEVVVKDKDFAKDDFVGRVNFDLTEVPVRVPPDSPLAPQWYRLEDKKGYKGRGGEIVLAVWMGTQADEAFPEAWHSDAHDIGHINLANTRSKVYFSPKLYYLRVKVFEARDLVPYDRSRVPDTYVKVVLGSQGRNTRPSQMRTVNPIWGEELMYVASEPFEEFIIVSVEDRVGPGRDETLGRVVVSFRDVPQRLETSKMPEPRWFNLMRPSYGDEDGKERHKEKFSSKILLGLTLEAGYHVLDESTHFSSNLQPSSKHLRKSNIGILELGILSARNLLPMKGRDGRTTDSYCVAKYGNKWVRTRTLLNTLHPKWNEQFSWEVFDPCTVITIGVFDNWHTNGHTDAQDKRIGKVRIRLSTLETDRIYTHYYPLLVLQPNGLKKHGEIQLALRFTCTAWVNMVEQYSRPLLPKMHYAHPIPVRYIDWLRHQAMQIVATRLARAEPPLRREVVEYMLDVDYHMWSLRRSKANFHRIMSVLSTVTGVFKWFNEICYWRNPITTCLVHILFLILVCYPELVLPTVFLYLFVIGLWNYRFRPRHPPHMDIRLFQAEHVHPDELDEEFDSFPTSRPVDIVRMRYDRLRSVAGRFQTVIGDLASQGERAHAILSWRDPRATAIFIVFALVSAVFIYVTPFQVVAVLVGVFMLRHPRFRSRMPSVPVNFFKRLPAKSDLLL